MPFDGSFRHEEPKPDPPEPSPTYLAMSGSVLAPVVTVLAVLFVIAVAVVVTQ